MIDDRDRDHPRRPRGQVPRAPGRGRATGRGGHVDYAITAGVVAVAVAARCWRSCWAGAGAGRRRRSSRSGGSEPWPAPGPQPHRPGPAAVRPSARGGRCMGSRGWLWVRGRRSACARSAGDRQRPGASSTAASCWRPRPSDRPRSRDLPGQSPQRRRPGPSAGEAVRPRRRHRTGSRQGHDPAAAPAAGTRSWRREGPPAQPAPRARRRRARSVIALLARLELNRESVLVIRGDTLVPGDAVLADDDVVEIRPVISGGREREVHACAEGPAVIDIRRHNANFCAEHFLRHVPRPGRQGDRRVLDDRRRASGCWWPCRAARTRLALWDILRRARLRGRRLLHRARHRRLQRRPAPTPRSRSPRSGA